MGFRRLFSLQLRERPEEETGFVDLAGDNFCGQVGSDGDFSSFEGVSDVGEEEEGCGEGIGGGR